MYSYKVLLEDCHDPSSVYPRFAYGVRITELAGNAKYEWQSTSTGKCLLLRESRIGEMNSKFQFLESRDTSVITHEAGRGEQKKN